MKNHHVDRLIAILEQQKDKASQSHFERLVDIRRSAEAMQMPSPGAAPSGRGGGRQLTPLEELLHKHMKRCIASYEGAYEELVRKRDALIARARSELAVKLAALHTAQQQRASEPGKAELAIAGLSRDCDAECARAQADFDRAVAALLEGYDRLLGEVLPTASFVPVSVALSIPARGIRFPKVTLKPVDHVDDIRRKLCDLMEQQHGDPIVAWGPDAVFRISGPLDSGVGSASTTTTTATLMDDPVKALHQYNVAAGSEIALIGTVQLKSELPRECFSAVFSKDKPDQRVDYFTCQDCKINWVCRPCAEQCHKGHKITPYVHNHRPTWACCYCAKTGVCKIVNSRTKKR